MTDVFAYGFSSRKIRFLSDFLNAGRDEPVKIHALKDLNAAPAGETIYLWGMTAPEGCAQAGRVIRVEDGFLRSAGLGAALAPPMSWVFDDLGLHIDAARPSRIEKILSEISLTPHEQDTARDLRRKILSRGISKYNLAGSVQVNRPPSRTVILVIGQVEDDASIRWGSPHTRTNLDLLKSVRARHPDAFLVYKPHPDVVAGLRHQGRGEVSASDVADQIVEQGDTVGLFPQVDAVHVMTSLAGFEALMRGLPVTCWGQPFYAGWGLTTDCVPIPRRQRNLTLDHLVAGALIHYPTYRTPDGEPATADEIVGLLSELRSARHNGEVAKIVQWALSMPVRLKSFRDNRRV